MTRRLGSSLRSRRLLYAALALFAWTGSATATEQIPEVLVMDGQRYSLFAEPFGQLLDQPAHWQTFRNTLEAGAGSCTANWRGYRGYWAITDDRLYLTRLESNACSDAPPEMPLEDYFPGQRAPVFADWFTGPLLIPLGPSLGNDHMGYSSRHPQYRLLDVSAGQVIGQRTLDQAQLDAWREAQRQAPGTTD